MEQIIKSRYSCRSFNDENVKKDDIDKILECGQWAPSGLNNQPWRFIIIEKDEEMKEKIASFTTSDHIIIGAKVNIVILMDKTSIYSRDKDIQGIGACIENMLLCAHDLGYGTCWLGQILNNSEKVIEILKLDKEKYELMAVVSIGVPKEEKAKPRKRKSLKELIINRY